MARFAALLVPLAWGEDLIPPSEIGYLWSGRGPACGSSPTLPCPPCTAVAPATRRTRRNLWTMSREEREVVYAAMDETKRLDQREGEARYGASFRSWDTMVLKHAVATLDPRGDQGHGSPAYVTFHRAFILEYERSLLAVDPEVGALPYVDLTDPAAMAIFGPLDLGSTTGEAGTGAVVDGRFKHWEVANFSAVAESAGQASLPGISRAGDADGALRGGPVAPKTRRVTRYPRCLETYQANRADAKRCHGSPDHAAWYHCVMAMHDLPRVAAGEIGGVRPRFMTTGALHFEGHTWLGSADGGLGYGCDASGLDVEGRVAVGDFWQARTSPNDPIFYFYHANLDRLHASWTAQGGPKNATAATYWDFEAASGDGKGDKKGTSLGDVVNAMWPFGGGLVDEKGGSGGTNLTHADVLCRLGPATAPYDYDDLPTFRENVCDLPPGDGEMPTIRSYHVHPVFDGADADAVALAKDLWHRFADFARVDLGAYDDTTPFCAFGHQGPGPAGYGKICPFPGHEGPFSPWTGDGLFGGGQYAFFVPLTLYTAAENWWRQHAAPPVHWFLHTNTGCANKDHGAWPVKSLGYPPFNQTVAGLYGCHDGPPSCDLSLVEYEAAAARGCLAFGADGVPALGACARKLDYRNGTTMWRETTNFVAGRDVLQAWRDADLCLAAATCGAGAPATLAKCGGGADDQFAWTATKALAWNASAGVLTSRCPGLCLAATGGALALLDCDDDRAAWTRAFLN